MYKGSAFSRAVADMAAALKSYDIEPSAVTIVIHKSTLDRVVPPIAWEYLPVLAPDKDQMYGVTFRVVPDKVKPVVEEDEDEDFWEDDYPW